MGLRAVVTVALAATLVALAAPGAAGDGIAVPDAGSYYHGVYPGGKTGWEDDITEADVAAYEAAAGRKVAWVYFSNNWFSKKKRAYPARTAGWIADHDSVPFIRLMLRSKQYPVRGPGPYPLAEIARGDWDRPLRRWGKAAAAFGRPILVDFGVEMNGRWFPWNGKWNGGPGKGPRRFRRAYRHVHDVIDATGADVTWVFHVNNGDYPDKPWNRFERYYPGDAYVDWVGLSDYGALTPCYGPGEWTTFAAGADDTIARLEELAPGKPVFVFEFGSSLGAPENHDGEDSVAWADHALDDLLADRWESVRGFSWWNETWENGAECSDTDMRVQSDPALGAVFSGHLAGNPKVVDHPLP